MKAGSPCGTALGGVRGKRVRTAANLVAACGADVGSHLLEDVDGERAHLTRTGSLTIPAREGDLHIFGQPPGDDTNADTWSATTIDAAGYSALDVRAGRITATAGARADSFVASSLSSSMPPEMSDALNRVLPIVSPTSFSSCTR